MCCNEKFQKNKENPFEVPVYEAEYVLLAGTAEHSADLEGGRATKRPRYELWRFNRG